MPTIKPRIQLTVSDELFDKIEAIRFKKGFRSKAEAALHLMEIGLNEELNSLPGENKRRIDQLEAEIAQAKQHLERVQQDVLSTNARIQSNYQEIQWIKERDLNPDIEISKDDVALARLEMRGGKHGK